MNPALSISGLTMRFGGVAALQDVAMEVEPGSFHGLIGPNGAGKTTLINCISRLVSPQAGQITCLGESLLPRRPHELARLGVTRTFQNFGLIGRFSTLENVMSGMYSRHPGRFVDDLLMPWRRNAAEKAVRQKALDALRFVGLSEYADTPAGTLPYGRRKAVELARALAPEPRLLLLDEPTAGLNESEMDALRSVLEKLRQASVTVLIITHHVEFLKEIADVVTVLNLGRKIAHGTPAAVTSDPAVITAYIGGAD